MLPEKYQGVKNFSDVFVNMYPELRANNVMVKNVTFDITEDCQLQCSYCYQGHKSRNRMSKETAKKAVDMLFEEYKKESGYINPENAIAVIIEFIGGEPLLEIELIDYIADYFKYKAAMEDHPWKNYYMFSVTTNGVLYDSPKVQSFIKKNKGRVSMSITLDGNKELHDSCRVFPDGSGSYDIAERAIKRQIHEFGSASTKLTIAPGNVAYLAAAIKNLYEIGIKDVHANCVYEEGWTVEHARILYEQMKGIADFIIEDDRYKGFTVSLFDQNIGQSIPEEDNQNWCGGTGHMMCIGPDGAIYPCLRYMPASLGPEVKPIIIGHIETGIESTDDQKGTVEMLKRINRRSQSTDECFNCPIARGCAWCSAYNYQVYGTPDKRATFICVMHKARVMANAYFWNKLNTRIGGKELYRLNIPQEWAVEIVGRNEYYKLKNNWLG